MSEKVVENAGCPSIQAPQSKAPQWVSDQFSAFEKKLNGGVSNPLHQVRKAAYSAFCSQGFPTTKQEEWKYTNLAQLSKKTFARAEDISEQSSSSAIQLQALTKAGIADSSWPRIVFVDGVYSAQLSSVANLSHGIVVRNLKAVLALPETDKDRALLTQHLAKYACYQEHPAVALNTSFLEEGALVSIESNINIEAPIAMVFVNTTQRDRALT